MVFKLVGADENGLFPSRVMTALRNIFEPAGLSTATKNSLNFANTFADVNSNGQQGVGSGFTKMAMPTKNSDTGSNYDGTNSLYIVPATGIYLMTAKLRVVDGSSGSNSSGVNVGIGINTAADDGSYFVWNSMPPMSAGYRMTFDYNRVARFTAGQSLQLYTYAQPSITFSSANMTVNRIA